MTQMATRRLISNRIAHDDVIRHIAIGAWKLVLPGRM